MTFTMNTPPAFASTTPLSTSSENPISAPKCTARPGITASFSRRDFAALALAALAVPSVATLGATPALADRTVQATRRAYERYYPRISSGGATLRSIGASLRSGDVAAAKLDVESKEFDVKFRRALSIYATTFSDNYVGQKTRDLQLVTNRLFDELDKVKQAPEVTEEVMEHYKIAAEAYTKYVNIARLPKELLVGI